MWSTNTLSEVVGDDPIIRCYPEIEFGNQMVNRSALPLGVKSQKLHIR